MSQKPLIVVIDNRVIIEIGKEMYIVEVDGSELSVLGMYEGDKHNEIYVVPVGTNKVKIGLV